MKKIKKDQVTHQSTKKNHLKHTQITFINIKIQDKAIQQNQLIVTMVMRRNNMIKCNKITDHRTENIPITKMMKLAIIK